MTSINSVTNLYNTYSKNAFDSGIQNNKTNNKGNVGDLAGVSGVHSVKGQKINMLSDLVQKLISNQADNWTRADFLNLGTDSALRIKSLVESGVPVSPEISAQAQEAISEDGFWGVEAVSDRLVDFAIALSGGDKSKYGLLKSSIEKGFKAAEKLWGGELPQISKDTFEATMRKLDEYFLD